MVKNIKTSLSGFKKRLKGQNEGITKKQNKTYKNLNLTKHCQYQIGITLLLLFTISRKSQNLTLAISYILSISDLNYISATDQRQIRKACTNFTLCISDLN